MQYLIKTYPNYDLKRYGTPWGAPCDSAGKPHFSGKVAHFTGGRGVGGDLFAEDPAEGSVWAYGQRNYFTNISDKKYVQFRGNAFIPLPETEVLAALKSTAQVISDDLRRDQIIKILLEELRSAEHTHTPPCLSDILETHGISPGELFTYGINLTQGDSI